jgi:hypothetical protein
MDASHFWNLHDLVIVLVTNPLVDHLMASHDHVLTDHVILERQRGHVMGQVT